MRAYLPIALALAASASAEPVVLSASDVVRLAREQAPAVAEARARTDEARALVAAARPSPEPGTVEISAGPRYGPADTTLDAEVAWEMPLDGGSRRTRRVGAAEAGSAVARLELDDARGAASAEALRAWYRALHADAIESLSRQRVALARELLEATRERERQGAIARFDVNAVAVETARAESELAKDAGEPPAARARLVALLGLDSGEPEPRGNLGDRAAFDRLTAAAGSADAAQLRPDVRAAQAAVTHAEAEVALVPQLAKPPLAFRVAAMREEESDVLLAGVVVPFAPASRARAEAEAAAARREIAKARAAARLRDARAEIAAASASYAAADRAARVLSEQGLAVAEENEQLAREGYLAGKFDLASLIVIRRDAQQARREHLDRLLDAALAGVDLWAALGAPDLGASP